MKRAPVKRLAALAPLLAFLVPSPGLASPPRAKVDGKALLHDSWSAQYRAPFGAVPAGTPVRLRLRTAKGGVSSVDLLVREYEPGGKQLAGLTQHLKKTSAGSTTRYQMWDTTFTPRSIGAFRYAFRIKLGASAAWYSSVTSDLGGTGRPYSKKPSAFFELTSYDASFKAPSWAQDAVIYQIFPDRFYNGNPANDTAGMQVAYGNVHTTFHSLWADRPVGGFDFFGGDLQGIIDKLPYLESLGINTIYLTPIFLAPSIHKYDTSDYMTIDPRFGTLQTFENLIAAAKADGIRIILDGVFNHTGSDSVYFNKYGDFSDVGAYQSKSSPYYSWYTFTSWPTVYTDWAGVSSLPQLNENGAVEDFIFRAPGSVAQHWASLGTAGWRLDAADQKSHTWWQSFRSSFKAVYPDDIMIGEATGGPIDALPWLMGNEMDGVMNYRFRDAVLGFFAGGRGTVLGRQINSSLFFDELMSMLEEYPKDATYSSMNLVDSHDTERILTSVFGNKQKLREIATFQATWIGAPTIYYGDETGLEGNTDPDDRRTFPWDSRDTALEAYYRAVIGIRNANPALRDGAVSPLVLDNQHRIVGFLRRDDRQRVAVVINDGAGARTVTLKIAGSHDGDRFTDALGGTMYAIHGGALKVGVPAAGAMILVPETS